MVTAVPMCTINKLTYALRAIATAVEFNDPTWLGAIGVMARETLAECESEIEAIKSQAMAPL